MKRVFLLSFLLLGGLFLTCKKDDNNPLTTTTTPSTGGTPEPTPVGIPMGPAMNVRIGPAGGTAASADGNLSVTIPAGALATDTTVSVQAITNNAPGGLGTAYRLGPSGMRFSSPVTLRFTYPSDSVQVPELLGVAFQDTDNIWYAMPDFSVDSTARTVSAPINHFSDWTDFEKVHISPESARLWVNQTVLLRLAEVMSLELIGQPQPIYRVTDNQVAWAASAGTIASGPSDPYCDCAPATYRAPSTIPAGNPVRVSATVNRRFTYHGTIVPTNRTVYFSYITITDSSASFHVKLMFDDPNYMVATLPFELTDTCDMDVLVNRRIVSVSNITNHQPVVTPTSAMAGQCTVTWIPGGPGPMNITSAYGTLDTLQNVGLVFLHAAFQEEFKYSCPGETPITLGGGPGGGNPGDLYFPSNTNGVLFNVNHYVWASVKRL